MLLAKNFIEALNGASSIMWNPVRNKYHPLAKRSQNQEKFYELEVQIVYKKELYDKALKIKNFSLQRVMQNNIKNVRHLKCEDVNCF